MPMGGWTTYMGYEVRKIFDANYGEVNTYHMRVWEKVYPNMEL
jgi:hypothetical protein|nr:MAG TPA: hypothetical protein [Bacteriophage sp.]